MITHSMNIFKYVDRISF